MKFTLDLEVKQWVACVKGHDEQGRETGRFAVFITGDDKFYLFHKIDPRDGSFTGLCHPVRKKDLRDDVRRALAHGHGNCGMRAADDGVPFRFLPPGARWMGGPVVVVAEEGQPAHSHGRRLIARYRRDA